MPGCTIPKSIGEAPAFGGNGKCNWDFELSLRRGSGPGVRAGSLGFNDDHSTANQVQSEATTETDNSIDTDNSVENEHSFNNDIDNSMENEESFNQADGLRLSLDWLATLNAPSIALITHDNYRHFVVVKGIKAEFCAGRRSDFRPAVVPRAEVEAMWNGVVLAIRRTPNGKVATGFNREEEWRPWVIAPLGAAPQVASPSDLARKHAGDLPDHTNHGDPPPQQQMDL